MPCTKDDAKDRFLEVVKSTPCLACGKYGVDIAHIKPWSAKISDFTRRTHKGVGWFFAIPLCRSCHEAQTASGNEHEWLRANVGLVRAYGWVAETVAGLCLGDDGAKQLARVALEILEEQ